MQELHWHFFIVKVYLLLVESVIIHHFEIHSMQNCTKIFLAKWLGSNIVSLSTLMSCSEHPKRHRNNLAEKEKCFDCHEFINLTKINSFIKFSVAKFLTVSIWTWNLISILLIANFDWITVLVESFQKYGQNWVIINNNNYVQNWNHTS